MLFKFVLAAFLLLALRMLYRFRTAQFYLKSILFAALVGFFSALSLPISIVCWILCKPGHGNWATGRAFYYGASYLLGLKFEVVGDTGDLLEQTKPAVILCNHQATIDVMLLGALFPTQCSIVVKKVLKYYPFLGMFLLLNQAIFIDRKNTKSALQNMAKAAESMKKKKLSVFMFPEGTRAHSKENTLLPFKKGGFHLAVQAQAPIIPVVVENYSWAYSSRSRWFPGGTIRVRVLPPIETAGKTEADVEALTQQTREVMTEALVEISKQRHVKDD
ncbi:uncharacterized protein VTP21DRAFT_1613 [Calcarisporiella thermophila]|uniref:uncharacterized protein n=1 Tax=Calcarisporiella thermophila TaxID=911321 RepID=UPI0037437736